MQNINHINLAGIDLNLLKAFDAIMRVRSVTKAAEQLAIGQPAMSQALARLRGLFDDELFVRSAQGMVPTRRANVIAAPISRALSEVAHALRDSGPFNPATDSHTFRIGMSDYAEAIMLPAIMQYLQSSAPNVNLVVLPIELGSYSQLLDDDAIDVAIGYLPHASSWHERSTLFLERRQCIYSRTRVTPMSPITMQDYVAHRHVVRSLAGNPVSFVDDTLHQHGLQRNVVLSAPHFSTLPFILQESALIATLPSRLVELFGVYDDLVASNLPFEAPTFEVSMLWHARSTSDPLTGWLREHLGSIAQDTHTPSTAVT